MLLNKRIIIGICGGIASYKAVDLVSKLQQAGALVDVILTEHAEDFVRPLTFSTMSHRPVYSDLWEASGRAAETHIALAEEAELLAIVPATANTIAKLAYGIADNMLTAVALATKAPLVLAPAMYRDMYTHPATQANLALLRERGACIIEPEVGRLASGAVGPGRLPTTEVLQGAISKALGRNGDLAHRLVVVTAGGTHEPIDPVRYVGNRSSGKMGYAIATEARDRGADVILISGPVALEAPYGVELRTVETALQMRDAVQSAITGADVLVMSAAVADFRPDTPAAQKLKKGNGGGEAQGFDAHGGLTLHLVRNPDILGELAGIPGSSETSHGQITDKGERSKRLVRVGFAAETNDIVTNAQSKLQAKHLDLLVANDVGRRDSGFGVETNKVIIFHATGQIEDLPVMPKTGVAATIWDRIVPLLSTTWIGERWLMMGDFVLELLSTRSTQEASTMDRAASAGFEGIAQMLLEQKKLMDALESENRELRRQLSDLRRGVGIAVVIEGKTIQLASDPGTPVPMNPQTQAALQSLQNLQNSQTNISSTYGQSSGRPTGGQQSVGLNGDKQQNTNSRGPLADSFVL